jgi:hypothetical protein
MSIETTSPFLQELEQRRTSVERFLVCAHELPRMSLDDRIEVIEDVIAFLAETLLPHAYAEEDLLYAESDRLLGRSGGAASSAADREEIRRHIQALVECEPRRTGRLQEELYALYLVASMHLQKEEEVYLRLVGLNPRSMERVMENMAAYAG